MAQAMKNPNEAGAASTDYLHLFGYAALAYLWARMAKIAQQKLAASNGKLSGDEKAFYDAKLATARFYMQRMLPRHNTHFANVMAGSTSIMAFADAAF